MAEVLCQIKKKGGGGGKYTETSLWTNSTPDASGGFAAQTVTLSDSIDNYEYIAIDYKFGTGTTDRTRVVYPVDEFKKSLNNSGVNHTCAYYGTQNSANDQFARRVYYDTSTSIGFTISTKLGANASYATQNIPLEILGLNELDHGTTDEVIFNLTNNTTSSAATTINLTTADLSDYKHLIFTASLTSTPLITAGTNNVLAVLPVDYFKNNSVTANYMSGSSGSGTFNNVTISYVDDNTVRFTRTATQGRAFNVFGIK